MRAATLAALAAIALGCATPPPHERPPEITSYTRLPGFVPVEEFVQQANRKLAIMDEGSGDLITGERFYYIAYLTSEQVTDPQPRGEDPLSAETQTLWHERRLALDPARYEFVFIDARVFPGTPGSRTRRAVFASNDGTWSSEEVASFVFERTHVW